MTPTWWSGSTALRTGIRKVGVDRLSEFERRHVTEECPVDSDRQLHAETALAVLRRPRAVVRHPRLVRVDTEVLPSGVRYIQLLQLLPAVGQRHPNKVLLHAVRPRRRCISQQYPQSVADQAGFQLRAVDVRPQSTTERTSDRQQPPAFHHEDVRRTATSEGIVVTPEVRRVVPRIRHDARVGRRHQIDDD